MKASSPPAAAPPPARRPRPHPLATHRKIEIHLFVNACERSNRCLRASFISTKYILITQLHFIETVSNDFYKNIKITLLCNIVHCNENFC